MRISLPLNELSRYHTTTQWNLQLKNNNIRQNNFLWNLYILDYVSSIGFKKFPQNPNLIYILQNYAKHLSLVSRNYKNTSIIANTSISEYKLFFKFNRRRLQASYNNFLTESKQPSQNSPLFKKSLIFFQIFLSNNSTHPNNLFKVHHIYTRYGLYTQNGQVMPFNTLKFYRIWTNFINLIYNIFYYKVNTLFLGSLFFRNETNALNFGVNGYSLSIFKYVNYGLFNINLRTNPNLKGIYALLRFRGFGTAFIFDLFNHQFTAQHLYNTKYFTIALSPISHFNPQISFNIPMMSSNLTNQLFFYRFLIKVKKSTLNSKYSRLKTSWNLRKPLNKL